MAEGGPCGVPWSVWVPPADAAAAAGDLSLCFQEAALALPITIVYLTALLARALCYRPPYAPNPP
jgi:hypothetical protein